MLARDLTPNRFLAFDRRRRPGSALAAGNAASHPAMLVRTPRVPLLVDLGGIDAVAGTVVLDAASRTGAGAPIVDPSLGTREHYGRRSAAAPHEALAAAGSVGRPSRRRAARSRRSRGGPRRSPARRQRRRVVTPRVLQPRPARAAGKKTLYAAYRHLLERLGGRSLLPADVRSGQRRAAAAREQPVSLPERGSPRSRPARALPAVTPCCDPGRDPGRGARALVADAADGEPGAGSGSRARAARRGGRRSRASGATLGHRGGNPGRCPGMRSTLPRSAPTTSPHTSWRQPGMRRGQWPSSPIHAILRSAGWAASWSGSPRSAGCQSRSLATRRPIRRDWNGSRCRPRPSAGSRSGSAATLADGRAAAAARRRNGGYGWACATARCSPCCRRPNWGNA